MNGWNEKVFESSGVSENGLPCEFALWAKTLGCTASAMPEQCMHLFKSLLGRKTKTNKTMEDPSH